MRNLTFLACLALTACQMSAPDKPGNVADRQAARVTKALADCAATRCAQLNLDGMQVTDFAPAFAMDHVTSLMASYTRFDNADLAAVATMRQLQELHVGSTDVTDLNGLRALPPLRLLHVQGNRVTDFSPIAAQTQLTELAVGRAELHDLRFLAGLTRLENLSLEGARIHRFDGLTGLNQLRALDLNETALPEDLSPLLRLRNLQELTISEYGLSDAQMAVLAQLEARGVTVSRTSPIIVC